MRNVVPATLSGQAMFRMDYQDDGFAFQLWLGPPHSSFKQVYFVGIKFEDGLTSVRHMYLSTAIYNLCVHHNILFHARASNC